MPIELTKQQQQSLDTAAEVPPRVVDPRTSASYVLIPAGDYEAVREVLDDERRQQTLRRIALKNAMGRMSEEP